MAPLGLGIERVKMAAVRTVGQLHVYNGNGKGKSSAALGLVLRYLGLGIAEPDKRPRVHLTRFLKGKNRVYNEDGAIAFLQAKFPLFIDHVRRGRDIDGDLKLNDVTPEDLVEAAEAWAIAKGAILSGLYGMIVLDELIPALSLGLVPMPDVIQTFESRGSTEIVVTGRGRPGPILAMADLHSEMVPQLNPNGINGFHIVTGNGKGKSTSALGSAMRAVGYAINEDDDEHRVLILQFLKGGSGYSEEPAIAAIREACPELVTHVRTGRPEICWYSSRVPEDWDLAQNAWDVAKKAIQSGKYKCVVLDELNSAADLGLLDAPQPTDRIFVEGVVRNENSVTLQEVCDVIANKPEGVEIIATGRSSRQHPYYDLAQSICTIECWKHYAEKGVDMLPGIDF